MGSNVLSSECLALQSFGLLGLLLGLALCLGNLQIFEAHLVPLVMAGLILIVFSSFNLEFIIFVFLFFLFFLGLWFRLRLFLFFLLVLFIIILALILPLKLILGPCEALFHLFYAFSNFCCLFFINSRLEIFLDHLRILCPLANKGLSPALRDVLST